MKTKEEENGITNVFSCEGRKHMSVMILPEEGERLYIK